MDVEKTKEFILNTLADVGVKLAEVDVTQARNERQMHGLLALAKIGMRQLGASGTSHKELTRSRKQLAALHKELAASRKLTEKAMRDLAASQKRTDEKFQRWLDRRHNGKAH